MSSSTSGTYAFAPALSEVVRYAFARIGMHGTEFTTEHLANARLAANMVLSDWSNEQVDLWEVGLQTVSLMAGTSTYDVPGNTVLILDAYIRTMQGSMPVDRVLYPISRTEWSDLPNKTTQGFPTTFWFDRLVSPTITLWPVPDASQQYSLQYYSVRQTQDAVLESGSQVEIPYRFTRAYADALSVELGILYPPKPPLTLDFLKAAAMESWRKASQRDAEDAPMFITAGLSAYYK